MSQHEFDREVELLRQLAPDRDRSFVAPGDDPSADALLARIVATPARRRRKWRFGVTIVAATVVLGAGVTAAVLRSRTPDDPTIVSCHSTGTNDTGEIIGVTPELGTDVFESCGNLWRDGTFGSVGPPPLVACVNEADATAVLPGGAQLCGQLGWELADIAAGASADPAGALASNLSREFAEQCFDPQAAREAVERVLEELGLEGWQVVDSGVSSESCTVAAADPGSRTVRLLDVPVIQGDERT